jgi:hypothetical protein
LDDQQGDDVVQEPSGDENFLENVRSFDPFTDPGVSKSHSSSEKIPSAHEKFQFIRSSGIIIRTCGCSFFIGKVSARPNHFPTTGVGYGNIDRGAPAAAGQMHCVLSWICHFAWHN